MDLDADGPEYQVTHAHEIGLLLSPLPTWKYVKCHQWMILTREFVEYLRTSSRGLLALAFFEHARIPDEFYFGYGTQYFSIYFVLIHFIFFIVASNTHFATKTHKDMKRFLTFQGDDFHPKLLTASDMYTLILHEPLNVTTSNDGRLPKYFFMRKVDVRLDDGRYVADWAVDNVVDRNLRDEKGYGELEGEAFSPNARAGKKKKPPQ